MTNQTLSALPKIDLIVWLNTFYTRERRLPLHLLMWCLLAILFELPLLLNYHLSFATSLYFLASALCGNAMIFYTFFYVVHPGLIARKKILLSVLACMGLVLLWRINGYVWSVIIYHSAYVENLKLRSNVTYAFTHGFLHALSPIRLFGGFIDLLYNLSPVFCIKITIETMKSAYRTLKMETERSALEIAFLKSQLNPHFLFNTLNSIYVLNRKADEAASALIVELSDTLRYTLYESNTDKVLVEKELDFLENYVKLETVRQPESTKITFNRNGVWEEDKYIVPLLTFPFVENAFKHGLGTSLKDAWLHIEVTLTGNLFHFRIRNSKNEENNSKPLPDYRGGIGVQNTKKRLRLLYPQRHELKIVNTPDEYTIDLKINL